MSTTATARAPRRASKHERVQRQREALRLRSGGASYRRIAERLGVTTRTVRRDLAEARDAFARPLTTREYADIVMTGLAQLDSIEQRAWAEYGAGTTVGQRLRALEAVRRAERTRFDLLRELGLLERSPPETAAHEEPPGLDVSPEQRQRLARLLIEDELTEVAEPEPEDITDDEHGDDEHAAGPSQ